MDGQCANRIIYLQFVEEIVPKTATNPPVAPTIIASQGLMTAHPAKNMKHDDLVELQIKRGISTVR